MPRPASADLTELPRYTFRRLANGEKMRLLNVLPAADPTEAVNCHLQHVPIPKPKIPVPEAPANSPQPKKAAYQDVVPPKLHYEAVSHRWGMGAENQSVRILEDGAAYHFKIHEDLFDAIIAFRDKSSTRTLWIDTICIDQLHLPEKNEQVARMSEVYSDAANVCIWLGPENKEQGSTQALDFLRPGKEGLNVYDFDDNCKDEAFVKSWAAFLTLLKREWFSRRWVVQEVSLAHRATIHCGSTWIQWEHFAAAVSLLNDIDVSSKSLSNAARELKSMNFPDDYFGEVRALTAVRLVDTANRIRSSVGAPQRTRTLEEVVARLAMFQSGEPRDYIYAFLALAKDSQPYAGIPDYLDGKLLTRFQKKALNAAVRLLPSSHRQSYMVDYQQEVVDVFQQFIAFAISKSADPALALDVLCRPFAPEDEKLTGKLPSWIPVVSELPFAPQINLKKGHFKMERQRGDPLVSMPDTTFHYNAAGRRPFDKYKLLFRKRSDHYSMFVEGFVLDEVVKVESASQQGFIPEDWVALARNQKDPEAFWRTLVAERGPKGDVPGIYGNAIKGALRVAHKGLDIAKHMKEHPSSIISDALPHVQNTIWGRCLLETGRGHLGLGPKKLERLSRERPRLLVCILHGCSVPVVLQEWTKSDDDIQREIQEDELDWQDRQKKASQRIAKLVDKVYEKRARKRGISVDPITDTRQSTPRRKRQRTKTFDGHVDRLPEPSAAASTRRGPSKRNGRTRPTRQQSSAASQQHPEPRDSPPPKKFYKVVGECYIHNMMHGEAIKWQNDTTIAGPEKRVLTQIFELR